MPVISDDMRTDISEALNEAMILMEAIKIGLEMALDRSSERDVKSVIGALGRYIADISKVLDEIDALISRLLDESAAPEAPPQKEIADALKFYADPANYEQVRGRPSKVAKDGGAKARKLQELLAGNGAAQ